MLQPVYPRTFITLAKGPVMKNLLCVFALFIGNVALAQTAPASTTQNALHTRELLWQKMTAEVTRVEQDFDGVMGVAIRDLTDGKEFTLNADDVFPTASSIKLPMLAELYRQSQTGSGAKLTDLYTFRREDLVPDSAIMENLTPGTSRVTNRDLAGFVVAVSDNSATNVLIDRVGMENVNHMLDSLGLHQTRLRRKMMDINAAKEGRENVSTPREMAALLEALHRGKLLNPEMTKDFFNLMCTTKDSPIPRLLPEGTRIANKPGELDGVRTDSGIVFLKQRPYVISVMTTYAHDEHAASQAISNISLIAYRYFEAVATGSEYGRKM
jgi:beta-lactamase class A